MLLLFLRNLFFSGKNPFFFYAITSVFVFSLSTFFIYMCVSVTVIFEEFVYLFFIVIFVVEVGQILVGEAMMERRLATGAWNFKRLSWLTDKHVYACICNFA